MCLASKCCVSSSTLPPCLSPHTHVFTLKLNNNHHSGDITLIPYMMVTTITTYWPTGRSVGALLKHNSGCDQIINIQQSYRILWLTMGTTNWSLHWLLLKHWTLQIPQTHNSLQSSDSTESTAHTHYHILNVKHICVFSLNSHCLYLWELTFIP